MKSTCPQKPVVQYALNQCLCSTFPIRGPYESKIAKGRLKRLETKTNWDQMYAIRTTPVRGHQKYRRKGHKDITLAVTCTWLVQHTSTECMLHICRRLGAGDTHKIRRGPHPWICQSLVGNRERKDITQKHDHYKTTTGQIGDATERFGRSTCANRKWGAGRSGKALLLSILGSKWAVRQEKEEFQEVRRSQEQVGNLGVSQLVSDTEYK